MSPGDAGVVDEDVQRLVPVAESRAESPDRVQGGQVQVHVLDQNASLSTELAVPARARLLFHLVYRLSTTTTTTKF